MTTVLLARLDSDGDVLLAGPAVRAVAAGADRVILLVGPRGQQAAALLPGVDDVEVWHCPWVDAEPSPVERADVLAIADRVAAHGVDHAVVFTSYHQSPLPTALLLRLAGVSRVSATSEDYPGSLLDLRHRLPEHGLHEVQRMLALVEAAGHPLPPDDDGSLSVRRPLPDPTALVGTGPYVVVHPGASVPARAATPQRMAEIVGALVTAGHRVAVTGGPAERGLTARVTAWAAADTPGALDLGGRTDFAGLAGLLDRADAVVVGNTGPAHLAAAVGTPVVSLFAPTVPAERWRPWAVPHALLGDQGAGCAGSRARDCPLPGHPCLDISPAAVVRAVAGLSAAAQPVGSAPTPVLEVMQ